MNRMKLLAKYVLIQIKKKNKRGKEGEEGRQEEPRERSGGSSCKDSLSPDINTVRHPWRGSTVHALSTSKPNGNKTKWQTNPREHSKKSVISLSSL